MYLLDSDYIIHFLNGNLSVVSIIQKIKQEKLCTSVICIGEILEGLEALKYTQKRKQFLQFVRAINVLDITFEVCQEFARLRYLLRKKGNLIDNFDILIASTCTAHKATLLTDNIRHFSRIPGLMVYNRES